MDIDIIDHDDERSMMMIRYHDDRGLRGMSIVVAKIIGGVQCMIWIMMKGGGMIEIGVVV